MRATEGETRQRLGLPAFRLQQLEMSLSPSLGSQGFWQPGAVLGFDFLALDCTGAHKPHAPAPWQPENGLGPGTAPRCCRTHGFPSPMGLPEHPPGVRVGASSLQWDHNSPWGVEQRLFWCQQCPADVETEPGPSYRAAPSPLCTLKALRPPHLRGCSKACALWVTW